MVPGELVLWCTSGYGVVKNKKRKVLDIFVLNPEPKKYGCKFVIFLPKYPVIVHHMNRDSLSKIGNH